LNRLAEPHDVTGADVRSRRTLEDADDAAHREERSARRDDPSVEHEATPTDTSDEDVEPHAEGVDRRCVREPHRLVAIHPGVIAETTRALADGPRDRAAERQIA
jgi:hypothetical protein